MALILDAGALIAFDRGDRHVAARLQDAQRAGIPVRTSAIVIAQAWRDPSGRQVRLGRLLRGLQIRSVDEDLARAAGILLGRSGASDAVDATVVAIAEHGDEILTSDPADLERLISAAERAIGIMRC